MTTRDLIPLIQGFPNLRNLYRNIPGYPDQPRVSLFQMPLVFTAPGQGPKSQWTLATVPSHGQSADSDTWPCCLQVFRGRRLGGQQLNILHKVSYHYIIISDPRIESKQEIPAN